MEHGEEVSGGFVVAGGEAAEVLELVEAALDDVAGAVEHRVEASAPRAAGGEHGDVDAAALGAGEVGEPGGVVTLVGDQRAPAQRAVDQAARGGDVVDLAGGQREPQRQAAAVDQRVQLGGQPAARAADRLGPPFLRAPAAC